MLLEDESVESWTRKILGSLLRENRSWGWDPYPDVIIGQTSALHQIACDKTGLRCQMF